MARPSCARNGGPRCGTCIHRLDGAVELLAHLESDEDKYDGKVSIWRHLPSGSLAIAWRGSEGVTNAKMDALSGQLRRYSSDDHLFYQNAQAPDEKGLRVGTGFALTCTRRGTTAWPPNRRDAKASCPAARLPVCSTAEHVPSAACAARASPAPRPRLARRTPV